jgi:hypothetical protein
VPTPLERFATKEAITQVFRFLAKDAVTGKYNGNYPFTSSRTNGILYLP